VAVLEFRVGYNVRATHRSSRLQRFVTLGSAIVPSGKDDKGHFPQRPLDGVRKNKSASAGTALFSTRCRFDGGAFLLVAFQALVRAIGTCQIIEQHLKSERRKDLFHRCCKWLKARLCGGAKAHARGRPCGSRLTKNSVPSKSAITLAARNIGITLKPYMPAPGWQRE
jgi:hypothetical protein